MNRMKSQNIDSYIFVKTKNQQDKRTDVIKAIRSISGIAVAQQHPKIKGLVEISYNPKDVNYTSIVNKIKDMGCESSFVDM